MVANHQNILAMDIEKNSQALRPSQGEVFVQGQCRAGMYLSGCWPG